MILETGKFLREMRVSYKKTQKQMACLFNVSRGTYSSWESRYKNKILPESVFEKLPSVVGILNSGKYINMYIIDEPLLSNIGPQICAKKESIWKRILKWVKN